MSTDGDGPDWLGLLKWSLSQTDGTSETESRPMSDEDVAFLTNVMSELVADEPKRMKEMLMDIASFLGEDVGEKEDSDEQTKISDLPYTEQEERIEEIFEELKDITCQIDMAIFFVTKLGGISCILDVLDNKKRVVSDHVRGCAASALGCLSQNNSEVQKSMFKRGEISRLMTLAMALATNTEIGSGVIPSEETTSIVSTALLSKVIYAVTSSVVSLGPAEEILIRGQYGADLIKSVLCLTTPSEDQTFIASRGSPHLATGSRTTILQIKRRILTMSRALLTSDSASTERQELLLDALIPSIYKELSADDSDLREACVGLLLDVLKLSSGEGRRAVQKAGGDSLDAILETRQQDLPIQLASVDPYDRDQLSLELAAVEEAVEILSTPIPETATTASIPQSNINGENEGSPSVLMLGI